MENTENPTEAATVLTYEKVCELLMESRQQMQEETQELKNSMDESQKRIEHNLAELSKNTDKSISEMSKNTETVREMTKSMEKTVKELSKNLGGIGNSLGRLTEAMFSPELWKKFRDLGFPFTKQSERVHYTENDQFLTEVDLVLDNGEYAMIVEIKTEMTNEYVNDHLERINIVRRCMDARNDNRKLVGAVAGGIVPGNVQLYAQKKGLYVVVQSGDTATIADAPKNFKPRVW